MVHMGHVVHWVLLHNAFFALTQRTHMVRRTGKPVWHTEPEHLLEDVDVAFTNSEDHMYREELF